MDKTTLFNIEEIQDALIETTLDEICDALREKGYNPVSQIVGYLVSGDEGFITTHNNARNKMKNLDRGRILELMVRNYIEN